MQHDHHYLLWLYVQGYGSHAFRRCVQDGIAPLDGWRVASLTHEDEDYETNAENQERKMPW